MPDPLDQERKITRIESAKLIMARLRAELSCTLGNLIAWFHSFPLLMCFNPICLCIFGWWHSLMVWHHFLFFIGLDWSPAAAPGC